MDKFTQSMDAKLWADEFCKLNPAADNGTMIGWFANAIMRGYDSGMVKGREQGMMEAAGLCQSFQPKDFTAAGIMTRAKCAEAILAAIREKP